MFLVYLAWSFTASSLRDPFDDELLWSMINAVLVSALIGGAIRYFGGQRRKNEQRVRDLEILNERLREDERQALARDLHDVVAHELTLITMQTMSRRRSGNVGELHRVREVLLRPLDPLGQQRSMRTRRWRVLLRVPVGVLSWPWGLWERSFVGRLDTE